MSMLFIIFQMFIFLLLAITCIQVNPSNFTIITQEVQKPLYAKQIIMGRTIKKNPLHIYILTKMQFTTIEDLYGKNVILIDSYMHARQPYSLQLMQSLYQSIIRKGYKNDIDFFLKSGVFIFYPFVNADGYQLYNQNQGRNKEIRKNLNTNNVRCQTGLAGVDINRNFPSSFGMIPESSYPCSQQYHGIAPFSQNEAIIFKQIFQKFKVLIAIDIHSYGNEWIYPYASDLTGQIVKKHRLYPFYQSIKQEFNSHNRKIKSCKESLGYVADGVYIDWALDNNALSFAFEVGLTFHSDSQASIKQDVEKAIKDFYLIFQWAEMKYQVLLQPDLLKIQSKSLVNMTLIVNISNKTIEKQLVSNSEIRFQFGPNDTYAIITTKENNKKRIISLHKSIEITSFTVMFAIALLLGGLLLSFYVRIRSHQKKQTQNKHVSISIDEISTTVY